MIKVSKNVYGLPLEKDRPIFTAKDIFGLLANLDELNDHKIRMREAYDGTLQIQIGDTVYVVHNANEPEII